MSMRRRLSDVVSILASLALLVFGVLLIGIGCHAIYWFFWSQATCGPDIGIGLFVGSLFIVYGKRAFVLAFDAVSPDARPTARRDAAVLVALAVLVLPFFVRPFLGQLVVLGREWTHASSRASETDALKANDDEPSFEDYGARYAEGVESSTRSNVDVVPNRAK